MPQPTLNEADKDVIVSAILTAAGWILVYLFAISVVVAIGYALIVGGD